MLFERAGS